MSDKETSREESAHPAPSNEENAGKSAAEDHAKKPADQCHGRYLDYFRQSLASEGETAYRRWGMPLFHSLNDEETESQRAALGFVPANALDFYNRGCLLAAREDYAGAAKAFEKASQLDDQLAEAVFNRAMALEKAGDIAKARSVWNQYLESFGEAEDVPEVKEHLGSLASA